MPHSSILGFIFFIFFVFGNSRRPNWCANMSCPKVGGKWEPAAAAWLPELHGLACAAHVNEGGSQRWEDRRESEDRGQLASPAALPPRAQIVSWVRVPDPAPQRAPAGTRPARVAAWVRNAARRAGVHARAAG